MESQTTLSKFPKQVIGKDTFTLFTVPQTRQILQYFYKYSEDEEFIINLTRQNRLKDSIIFEKNNQYAFQKNILDNYKYQSDQLQLSYNNQGKELTTITKKYTSLKKFQKWYWIVIGGISIYAIIK